MLPLNDRIKQFQDSLSIVRQPKKPLMSKEEGTIESCVDPSYISRLTEWAGSSDCRQRVATSILKTEIKNQYVIKTSKFLVNVRIDCRGLDTFPPLPNQIKDGISLTLKGHPNVTLEILLTHVPDNVVELEFNSNTAIQTLSSEMVPVSIIKLTISGCPNLACFAGKFTISTLTLSDIGCRSLSFSKDNFPCLINLVLISNTTLESIEVSENEKSNSFELSIYGDHNKLTAIPRLTRLDNRKTFTSELDSISDYSWAFDATKGFKLRPDDVIKLVKKYHQQGKPVATLTLMEMAEYILTPGRAVSKQFATTCLEGLISIGPVSYDRAELLLGKLFLEGKLIDSNYEKAQKFFQLAIDREENPLKKEPLKQAIEVLERKYFHDFYQKIRLFSYSDEEISLPPELSQYIFSMGVAAIKKEPR